MNDNSAVQGGAGRCDRAYRAGWNAFQKGRPRNSCPYNWEGFAAMAWQDGFDAARKEREDGFWVQGVATGWVANGGQG